MNWRKREKRKKILIIFMILALLTSLYFVYDFVKTKNNDPSQKTTAYHKKVTSTPTQMANMSPRPTSEANTSTPSGITPISPSESVTGEPTTETTITPTEDIIPSGSISPTEEITGEPSDIPVPRPSDTPIIVTATATPIIVTATPTNTPIIIPRPTEKPANTPTKVPTKVPTLAPTNTPRPTPTPKPKPTVAADMVEYVPTEKLAIAINDYRRQAGVNELKTTDKLQRIAQKRLEEIHQTGLDHVRPDGSKGLSIFEEYGVYKETGGELFHSTYNLDLTNNLYGWTKFPPNKDVLIDSKYTLVATAMDDEYAVALFIKLLVY